MYGECFKIHSSFGLRPIADRGRRGCDRVVVGFTTTYAISAYHNWCCESTLDQGEVHNIMW